VEFPLPVVHEQDREWTSTVAQSQFVEGGRMIWDVVIVVALAVFAYTLLFRIDWSRRYPSETRAGLVASLCLSLAWVIFGIRHVF
jgi:hypothetical protein